jgi:hypothetical protein
MSFDSWVVGFGLSRILIELSLVETPLAYAVWLAVILTDAYLLLRFFGRRWSDGRALVFQGMAFPQD